MKIVSYYGLNRLSIIMIAGHGDRVLLHRLLHDWWASDRALVKRRRLKLLFWFITVHHSDDSFAGQKIEPDDDVIPDLLWSIHTNDEVVMDDAFALFGYDQHFVVP